jgi:tight adherence protein C
VITAALCGGLFAIALVVAWRALVPARPSLQTALASRRTERALVFAPSSMDGMLRARLADVTTRAIAAAGIDMESAVRSDLAVLARPFDRHVADKALAAIAGALLPWAWWTILATTVGVVMTPALPVVGSIALALGGFLLPDVVLRSEAERRRRDMRAAVGSLLDLVVISMAGGAGIEAALDEACSIGRSWPFAFVQNALDGARLRSEGPWDALADLGRVIGVDDLVELAATVSLAGTEGSRIRESLQAKAGAMRDRELAEEEARAQSATERMAVPTVMLMAGFILLVGYPAVRAVMTGL